MDLEKKRVLASFFLTFLVLLPLLSNQTAVWANEKEVVMARAEKFYRTLKGQRFEDTWGFLSSGNRKNQDKSRYISRLTKSASLIKLHSFSVKDVKLYKRAGGPATYAEVISDLAFVDKEGEHRSRHFILWVNEQGEWFFEDERSLERGELPSSLPPWKLRINGLDSQPVGEISAIPDRALVTFWIVETPASHPYLRVAQEAGLFRMKGLDIKFLSLNDENLAISALIANKVHAANITLNALAWSTTRQMAQLRNPIVMLSNSGTLIGEIFSASRDITRPEDMRGKKIAITGFPAFYKTVVLSKLSSIAGTKELLYADIDEPAAIITALGDGRVDAVLASPTHAALFPVRGYSTVATMITQGSGIATTRKFLQQKGNEELARRFLKVHLEAFPYFKENKAKSLRVMARLMREVDIEKLEQDYNFYVTAVPATPYTRIEDVASVLSWKGLKFDPQRLVDNDLIRAVLAEK